MKIQNTIFCISLFMVVAAGQVSAQSSLVWEKGRLTVSWNGRYLQYENGEPFFYLGDTGWLLCTKLTREEVELYLENRRQKGFNVIQMMLLHTIPAVNVYGDSALEGMDISKPKVTPGNNPEDPEEYDYWDHVSYIVGRAAEKGIFIGMVPLWGTNVKAGLVSEQTATLYAQWLAERYRTAPNIIWINGGDIQGTVHPEVWNAIGMTLRSLDTNHLITFHPYGRTQSSTWFHEAPWLDFNMVQSGHRRYDQDPHGFGEDNWKYIDKDFKKLPIKPTMDGEPSYEGIPQGLHDTTQPRWSAADIRRYAYWSVLAGACGFTYGHNSIMQFYKPNDRKKSYGAREYWYAALDADGASQMKYLQSFIQENNFFERVHDQSPLLSNNGIRYDYIMVSRGKGIVAVYTYTGASFTLDMKKISSKTVSAAWFNPRIGVTMYFGTYTVKGAQTFDPPEEPYPGNDWLLILKDEE